MNALQLHPKLLSSFDLFVAFFKKEKKRKVYENYSFRFGMYCKFCFSRFTASAEQMFKI